MPSSRVPSSAAGSVGWGGCRGCNAAVSGKWILQKVWGVSVGKLVMGSVKSQTRWEPINYYRIVRSKGKKVSRVYLFF
jgi:hypothetical protein